MRPMAVGFLAWALAVVWCAHGQGAQFVAPADDLVTLDVPGGRFTIAHDGSFVLQRGYHFIGDMALRTSSSTTHTLFIQNQPRTGLQTPDGARLADTGVLAIDGWFTEPESGARVDVRERLSADGDGLRADYRVSVADPVAFGRLGWQLTLPIQHYGGGLAVLTMPGEDEGQRPTRSVIPLPSERPDQRVLGMGAAIELELHGPEGPMAQVAFEEPVWCIVEDARLQERYTYVVSFEMALPRGRLSPQTPLDFSLTMVPEPGEELGHAPSAQPPYPSLTPQAPVIPLSDDWVTRGDWLGAYGQEAYVLPGGARLDECGGDLWPVPYRIYVPTDDDVVRGWVGRPVETRDRRALTMMRARVRQPISADDHGEAYPLGTGPDLCVDLCVPAGEHLLSVYLYEIDWPQYRDYAITVSDPSGAELARWHAHEFYPGVYKRAAVLGPRTLALRIHRGMSSNATVNGLFLDPLPPDWRTASFDAPGAAMQARLEHVHGVDSSVEGLHALLSAGRDDEALAVAREAIGDPTAPESAWMAVIASALQSQRNVEEVDVPQMAHPADDGERAEADLVHEISQDIRAVLARQAAKRRSRDGQ